LNSTGRLGTLYSFGLGSPELSTPPEKRYSINVAEKEKRVMVTFYLGLNKVPLLIGNMELNLNLLPRLGWGWDPEPREETCPRWAWWSTPVVLPLSGLRQEYIKFEASQGYTVRHGLKKKEKERGREEKEERRNEGRKMSCW
jgi:hypothetical protein